MGEPTGEIITTAEKPFIERRNGLAHIVNPEGIYDILYGIHKFKSQNPIQIDESVSGLILENTSTTPISNNPQDLKRLSSWMREGKQYCAIVKRAEELNIPIYFVDSGLTAKAETIDFLSGYQVSVGLYLLLQLAHQVSHLQLNTMSPEEVARIGFLTLAGLWTSVPAVVQTAEIASHLANIGKDTTHSLMQTVRKVNPIYHYFTVNLRNRVIAHKMQWLMRHAQKTNPQFNRLSIVVGAGHAGMEKLFLDDFDKLEKRNMDSKSLMKFGLQKETIPTIAEFRFDQIEQEWKRTALLKVPELNPS